MHGLLGVLRVLVFAAVAVTALAAIASWLVRSGRVKAASPLGQSLRRLSEPILKPMEERLVRAGGNPVHAGWWLVVVVAVVGILTIGLLEFLANRFMETRAAFSMGPRGLLALVIIWSVNIITAAIFVRVIGSWLGLSYKPWMQPVAAVADPVLRPARRLLPPLGGLDFSPLITLFALWLLREILLGIIW